MKKLFTNDRFFLAMVIFAVVGNILYFIMCCMMSIDWSASQFPVLLESLCVIFLYYSYKKHSKNVMKGLIGALLMSQLVLGINNLSTLSVPGDYITVPVYVVLTAAIFINHFVINSDHHSSPAKIRLNQILVLLIILDFVVWDGLWFFADYSGVMLVCSLGFFFGQIGITASIVCVESRLDAYRLDREAAGWTEETGYPEGYVH